MLRLRQLKRAGYPFRAGDLSLSTWLALGELEELMEALSARRGQRDLPGVESDGQRE